MNPSHSPDEASIEQRAVRRVKIKMAFYTHLLVFVLVNLGLAVIWQFRHGDSGWGSAGGWGGWGGHGMPFPIWGWALGLTIHGIVTLIRLQGEGMRRRMVEREAEALRRREPK